MRFLNSVKALYTAVGILFLTVAIGSYVDTKNEAMHSRHLEINTGLERMVRLNQELTNMLLIAVLERNSLRAASYETVNNDLDQTIKTVVDLTKMQNLHQEITSLSEGHTQLHTIEENVIKLMSADKWEEARSVLFGDEYVFAKKTYEVDSESAVSAVTGELASIAQRFSKIRTGALGMRIGALVLLLWIGIMFSRRTRTDLSEQIRLRDEIATANEALEERVRARTADLEETTEQLRINEDNSRRMLDRIPVAMAAMDKGGRFILLNDRFISTFGYTLEDMPTVDDWWPLAYPDPQYRQEVLDSWKGAAAKTGADNKKKASQEWKVTCKDGTVRDIDVRMASLLDMNIAVFLDVTERKKAEGEANLRMEELEQFNRLVVGREDRMIQLKSEINALLEELGRDKKYKAIDEELS